MIRPQACPICKKPVTLDDEDALQAFPFCSDRCRQIDFFRWTDGRYAIVEPLDPETLGTGTQTDEIEQ